MSLPFLCIKQQSNNKLTERIGWLGPPLVVKLNIYFMVTKYYRPRLSTINDSFTNILTNEPFFCDGLDTTTHSTRTPSTRVSILRSTTIVHIALTVYKDKTYVNNSWSDSLTNFRKIYIRVNLNTGYSI